MAEDETIIEINKSDYIMWYNLARDTIKNEELIPTRTSAEIIDLVSRENWLLFCLKGDTKEITINKDEPNIFFDLHSREGRFKDNGRIGLTFNNLKSYERFKLIMKGMNKEIKDKITERLLQLNSDWKINIKRKIKDYNYGQPPKYKLEKEWQSNQLNETIVDEIITIGNLIREQGINERQKREPKYYFEGPAINFMESEFSLQEEIFKDKILEAFNILSLCLKIPTGVEINQEVRRMDKRIAELEVLKEHKEEHIKKLKLLKDVSFFSKEDVEKQEIKLEELKKELEDLKKKVEENK